MASTSEPIAETTDPPRGYPDLHDHVEALRKAGLLVEIDIEINKDTEMHPLVRWQFRGGIAEEDRKAFLFTNVTDAKGRKYDMPVLVCGLAPSSAIYSGMGSMPFPYRYRHRVSITPRIRRQATSSPRIRIPAFRISVTTGAR